MILQGHRPVTNGGSVLKCVSGVHICKHVRSLMIGNLKAFNAETLTLQ